MMKKVLSMMLVLVMLFGFAACGGSKQFDTVSEYIASDAMQEELATLQSGMANSGMEIDVVGEGDKLVYVYTFTTQLEITDAVVDAFESALDEQASTFEEVAASIKTVVDVDDPIVVVRYLNADSSLIYEQEFTAK